MIRGEPTAAIIDADFFVYRIGFSCEDEEQSLAEARLTEWFTDIVYFKLKVDTFKAYITGKTNFRNEIAVTHPYKGNRKDFVKPKHYEALRSRLIRMGAEVTDNEEADDAVAIESCRSNSWIVHQDKDLDQLEGWHYNPIKEHKYYVTAFEGLKNFYRQMLTGDRIDHIVGLRGIGPVKADRLIKDCNTEIELYTAVCEAYEKAGEPLERVIENARLLWLRREEGQLWEPPIETKQRKGEGQELTAMGAEEAARVCS